MSHRQRQQEKTLTIIINGIAVKKIGRGAFRAVVKIEGSEHKVTGSRAHVARACYQSEEDYRPTFAGYQSTLCQACDEPLNADEITATCDECGALICGMCFVTSPFCPACDSTMSK